MQTLLDKIYLKSPQRVRDSSGRNTAHLDHKRQEVTGNKGSRKQAEKTTPPATSFQGRGRMSQGGAQRRRTTPGLESSSSRKCPHTPGVDW